MRGLARHLTYANVMATIAVFISLGAGAYAISRNDVKSKHIAPGAVKLSDTNTKLRLKCSGGTLFVEGACMERTTRTPDDWDAATNDCFGDGRRLPSPAELLLARRHPGITLAGFEWTHDIAQGTEGGRIAVVTEDTHTFSVLDVNNAYRCVAAPRR